MPRELPEGTVTILFTDVVDSTALSAGRGDEPAHAILERQRALISRQIDEHSGYLVKTMGDGFMVAFASARQGVACAVEIQRSLDHDAGAHPGAALQVRIGLNTGETISQGGDYFGSAVNAAGRIMHKASGGQVLVSEAVRSVLGAGSEIQLDDRGRFRLKGFTERWRLYEVRWRAESAATPPPTVEGLPFVSRERELARLKRALDQAQAGEGSLLLIGGEAGVGKTRLADECAIEWRKRGFVTLAGRGYEDGGASPYGPFVEIIEAAARELPEQALKARFGDASRTIAQIVPSLSRLDPEFTPVPDHHGAFVKQSLFAAIRTFLTNMASAQPLLLLLDDLHWADAASLQLLRFLARGLREMPIAIVCTYREGVFDMSAPLAEALNELHAKRLAIEIDLKPFGVDAVETLLRAASGRPPPPAVARMLHAETSGNAYFIEELYRHLAEEGRLFDEGGAWLPARRIDEDALPKGLRLVIERRLSRLSDATRGVLDAAAVLGTTFDVDLLEAASATHGDHLLDCLDEAERARIIVPDAEDRDGRFGFAHPLMRAAILSALPSSQRQRLHVRAAAAIETSNERSPALDSELAHHYHAAGRLAEPSRAIAAFRRAGGTALATYANVDAANHLEAALKLAERIPEFPKGDLAEILHHRGQTQYRLGEWQRSGASLDRALALYRDAGDARGEAQVLYAKSSLATFDSRPTDALTFLRRARELMPDDQPLKALVLQLESQNLADLRQYEEAARAADEAIAIGERLDDAYVRNHARIASGYFALATLDIVRAVDDFSRVSSAPVASPHERMGAESRRAIALAWLGALDEAEERGARARTHFHGVREHDEAVGDAAERDPYEFGLSCLSHGIAGIARGQFTEVHQFLRDAVEECGVPQNVRVVNFLTPMVVQTLHCLGRYEDAIAAVETFAPVVKGHQPAFRRLYAALSAAARGETAEASIDPAPFHARPDSRSLAVAILATETAIARRDADAARLQLDALEHLRERRMVFSSGWVVLIPRLLGAVHVLIGNELRAAEILGIALELARSSGANAELALTHLELAELRTARGDTGSARTDLAEAKRLLAALRMRSCDARIAEISRRLTLAEPPRSDGLTEHELEILRLVAAGLSNRAIALQQSLNERAIQRQLAAIYGKIGADNRVAAIAYAYKKGIARDGD